MLPCWLLVGQCYTLRGASTDNKQTPLLLLVLLARFRRSIRIICQRWLGQWRSANTQRAEESSGSPRLKLPVMRLGERANVSQPSSLPRKSLLSRLARIEFRRGPRRRRRASERASEDKAKTTTEIDVGGADRLCCFHSRRNLTARRRSVRLSSSASDAFLRRPVDNQAARDH